MKIEVSEEGIVFCDGITCLNWIETDTTCENCPIDKLFFLLKVNKHFAEKAKKKYTMTREEEIGTAAFEYICRNDVTDNEYISSVSFIDGAKWADKTMIEKACEWLKELFENWENMTDYNPMEDFRKAMLKEE